MTLPASFTLPSRRASQRGYRAWSVRTVVVHLSRKLKATYRIRGERCLSRLLTTLLAAMPTWALADLPSGLNVVAGQATASMPSANSMRINQATDKAVLNWQSFNIGASQSVQFVQPATTSVALNRIVGNQASSIYGSLSANGQVFLVNPSGVMFAPGAQVNVGGLVASSLAIGNEDFMAGRYTFSGQGSGAVSNHGNINAARGGYVLLAASQVNNTGAISADAGAIGLAAGSRVTLDAAGVGLVRFSVDAAAANAAIANSGSIVANGGQVAVLASAVGDALATVINQTGVIRADSAVERNGMIVLSGGASGVVRLSGALSATGTAPGQTGGTVQVLGDKVLLAPGASIDASGHSGGGTVLVGGDYQGSNASVQNASRVYVASDTSLNADATGHGNGGKVVVWADGDTRFAGSISARGGAQGGNGGFVEVSGKQNLDMQGQIDVAAPQGTGGNVLLDPKNIVLSTTANNPRAVTNQNLNTPDLAFADAPASGTYTVNIASVTGFNELFLQATNNITVSSAVAMGAGNSIRLEANNDIAVNAGISVTGAGSINLRADADSSGAGSLTLTSALSAQAGGITLRGASVTGTGTTSTISSTGAANSNAGNISITADTGGVALAAGVTANGGTTTSVGRNAGNVTITAKTGIATAAITASGTAGAAGNNNGGAAGVISLTNNTSGDITTTGALTSQTGNATGTGLGGTAGSISVTNNASGGNVTTAALTTLGGTKGAGGNITVSAAGAGELKTNGAAITSSGGGGLTSAGANAGNITLTGGTVTLGASVLTASGGNGNGTSFAGGNGGAISVTSNQGGMTATNTGAIRANGGAASGTAAAGGAAGTITVTNAAASTGAINLAGTLIARTGASVGTTAALAAGSITVNNNATARTATTLGALSTEGNANGNGGQVNITATGTVAFGGALANNGTGGTQRGDVTILAGDAITQTGAIVTRNLSARTAKDGGAAITLTNTGNDAETVNLQARNGSVAAVGTANANVAISYTDANAVVISGINNGTSGTAGAVTLLAGGAITQTGAIKASTLTATTANAAGAAITLSNTGNDVATVNLQARAGTVAAVGAANANAAISYTDANGFAISGIATTGNVTLTATGQVTQSGAITATGLALIGTGGAYTLNQAGNAITTLAANTGSINYKQSGALAVGTVGAVAGVTTTGTTQIETTDADAHLTLDNAVTSGATGDAIILKAGSDNAAGVGTGGQLINNVGPGGIVASSGRYLAYSGDPGSTLEGMEGYAERYNADATFVPEGTASNFVYRMAAPAQDIIAGTGSKAYDAGALTVASTAVLLAVNRQRDRDQRCTVTSGGGSSSTASGNTQILSSDQSCD